jgi:TRAP-type C4-dicarboxylate transport system, small permease component
MNRTIAMLATLEKGLALAQRVVLVAAVGLIAVLIVAQIFLRVVLKSPLFGVEEIALIAGTWLYLIGAAYCTREHSHIEASMVHLIFKRAAASGIGPLSGQRRQHDPGRGHGQMGL